jgi:hypothetical protein
VLLDARTEQVVFDAGLRIRVGQLVPDRCRAAGRAVPRGRAEPGVPEQVVPVRVRGEARHHGVARIGQVVGEAGQFMVLHSGVDEQHAGAALHDDGVALHELALVDQHTLRDLRQHGGPFPLVVCNRWSDASTCRW